MIKEITQENFLTLKKPKCPDGKCQSDAQNKSEKDYPYQQNFRTLEIKGS